MRIYLPLAIAVALAAAVSRQLAARQNRKVTAWVVWTLWLGGLPAFYLVISELFGTRGSEASPRHSCCDDETFSPLTDLGHAGSYDFRLGECTQCRGKLMESSYYGMTHIGKITDAEAKRFLRLEDTELKWALKEWHG